MLRQLVQCNSGNVVLVPIVTGSAVNSMASSVVNTRVNMTVSSPMTTVNSVPVNFTVYQATVTISSGTRIHI